MQKYECRNTNPAGKRISQRILWATSLWDNVCRNPAGSSRNPKGSPSEEKSCMNPADSPKINPAGLFPEELHTGLLQELSYSKMPPKSCGICCR